MRQIMTACLLSALFALPASAENLLDGSYLITSVAPVSADAGADIADDLLESARASWLVVMDHEMRAYRLDEPGATLTMPGIAGIVLTLGMAVDANVLISERIREEVRAGNSPMAALRSASGSVARCWSIMPSLPVVPKNSTFHIAIVWLR